MREQFVKSGEWKLTNSKIEKSLEVFNKYQTGSNSKNNTQYSGKCYINNLNDKFLAVFNRILLFFVEIETFLEIFRRFRSKIAIFCPKRYVSSRNWFTLLKVTFVLNVHFWSKITCFKN